MSARLGSRGTGQAGQPIWWARWAVRSASLPLPSEHRWRYRKEFLAELYGMTPSEQRHHAAGVLSRVWTLRVALSEPARFKPKEATMAATAHATPVATCSRMKSGFDRRFAGFYFAGNAFTNPSFSLQRD